MDMSNIELVDFIRADMIEFLDEKMISMKGGQGVKDFYDLMHDALVKHESDKARVILEQAIDDYNETPDSSVYKDIKIKRIHEIVQMGKRYLIASGDKDGLADDLKSIEESPEFEMSKPPRITALDDNKKQRQQKEFDERAKEYEQKEKLTEQIKDVTKDLFINIRKKDLTASVEKYKQLRSLFDKFPNQFLEDKKSIYNDILSFYLQIQMMKKNMQEDQKDHAKEFTKEVKESMDDEKKYLKIDEIKAIIGEITQDTKNSQFDSARQKVIELKHMTSLIPDKYKVIRDNLEQKIDAINQRVEFAKRIAEQGA